MSVCGREKCAFRRKPYPPGEHGRQRRHSPRGSSEYRLELFEKQKLKSLYALRETQFRNYVKEATRRSGNAAKNLIEILESRLDNIIFRLGFVPSRTMARQLVSHGHFTVNGRRVSIPSFRTRKGDVVRIRAQSVNKGMFRDLDIYFKKYEPPTWLSLDKEKKEGRIISLPDLSVEPSLSSNLNLNAVVEFYSR
jgi:small subunit ribosomal protein S4